MTAPLRRDGRLVADIEKEQREEAARLARRCASKSRYADEYAARGSGTRQMKFVKKQIYIYQCQICRGWHLTSKWQPPPFSADYFERKLYES